MSAPGIISDGKGDGTSGLRTAALVAVFGAAIVASFFLLPQTMALLAAIALVVLFIIVDAVSHRYILRMSLRNVRRRPSTTVLVLGGLLVGASIISSAMVVGDTMNNMVVRQITDGMAGIDFLIGNESGSVSHFYDEEYMSNVTGELRDIEDIAAVEAFVTTTAGANDTSNGLRISSVGVMGLTSGLIDDFGGLVDEDGTQITSVPVTGQGYINRKLANALDASEGDRVQLSRGGGELINVTVSAIVQDEGLGGYQGSAYMFVDLASAQDLSGHQGQLNYIAVSIAGNPVADTPKVKGLRTSINSTLESLGGQLHIVQDKAKSIVNGKNSIAYLISVFYVFGSFSIVAGMVLVVSLFTMLGEERKAELGVSRALGMPRSLLRRLLTYEGLVYAAIAAGVGTVLGLGLAYMMIIAISDYITEGAGSLSQYFYYSPLTLVQAYMIGFLLTLATVFLVTIRISRLNIVRAVRNIPEPAVPRNDRRTMLLGGAMVAAGAFLIFAGVDVEDQTTAMSGLSLITLSIGLLLRRAIGDRIAWTVSGAVTLFIWLPLVTIFPYKLNIEMFFVAGIFMVSSALILIISNSNSIIAAFTGVLRFKGVYRAVVRTAISYPLKSRFRTALSIFIFGLVIFTVTTITMISGIMSAGLPQMIRDTSGGFDVIAFSDASVEPALDLWGQINTTGGLVRPENVTMVVSLSIGQALVARNSSSTGASNDQFAYNVIGFNEELYTKGSYPLKDWDKANYSTDREAWDAALDDPSLIIVDGTAANKDLSQYGIGSSMLSDTKVGDRLTLTNATGAEWTVTIIGITRQSAFTGLFIQERYVREELLVPSNNLFLIKLAANLDSDRQATLLQSEFFNYQLDTLSMKALAKDAVDQTDSFFNLMRAFLAMGLIVGVAGLGIITARSIRERRIEIGMMRAIGYTRRLVVLNFALEAGFISILGIVVGTALGIVVGYQIWDTGFRAVHFPFLIPWVGIILVGMGTFIATMLIVVPAARGANKVSPAEVLRFE